MLINDKNPEDVLKPDFLQQYNELHQDIWHRLIQINTNIQILETIQKFPFHRIYYPKENIFWESVYWNFLYTSVALIHTLVTDAGNGEHTLMRFKNRVRPWLVDSEKPAYQALLKTVKFAREIQAIRQKVAAIRHKVVAHRFLDASPSPQVQSVEGVTVSQLRSLYDVTEKIFCACSFGTEYLTTLYPKGTCAGKPIEKDIDHILDLIVKDSPWLNHPERRGELWKDERQYKSEEYLNELNTWRQKFGLPPA